MIFVVVEQTIVTSALSPGLPLLLVSYQLLYFKKLKDGNLWQIMNSKIV